MTAPLPTMPSVKDFIRMGPERTAEWHRRSGIEAKVAAAIAEADESTSQRPFCTRCGSGLSNSEALAHGGLCCACAPAFSGFASTEDRTMSDSQKHPDIASDSFPHAAYLCPHDLDLRIHPRCYLCKPDDEGEEPE